MYFLGPLGRKGAFHNTIYRCTFWALWNKKDHCTYIHINSDLAAFGQWGVVAEPGLAPCIGSKIAQKTSAGKNEREVVPWTLWSQKPQSPAWPVPREDPKKDLEKEPKGLKSNIGKGIWSKAWTAHFWCNIFCAECLSQRTKTINQDKQWWAWHKYVSASSGNGKWYAETRH
jgi:hypothetical protein